MKNRTAIANSAVVGIIVVIIVVAAVGVYFYTTSTPATTTTSTTTSASQTSTSPPVTTLTVPNVPQAAIQAFYPATPITINEYAWSGYPLPQAVQDFEAAFPNIHVAQSPNQDVSGLLSALETHQYVYDSFRIQYFQLAQEVATGEVMNIAPWFNQYLSALSSQISPSALALVTAGQPGKMYCIPEDFGPVAFAYRQDLFTKYGLTVPQTWAQFQTDAQKLHSENSSITMTVFPPNEPSADLMGLFWAQGGNMIVPVNSTAYNVEINSTTNINVINYWGNLINSHEVQAINLYTPQFNQELAGSEIASFVTAAAWYPRYVIQSTAPGQSGLWRVANMPQNSTSSLTTGVVGGSCLGVTSNAKYPGPAFLFDYFTTQTPQVLPYMWTQGGQWTSNSYYLQNLAYSNGTKVFLSNSTYWGGQDIGQVYLTAQQHAGTQWQWSPYQITLQEILQEQLTEAAAGQITFAQALQNTETIMISYIQSNGGIVASVGH
ncbi:MAG: extracellular solute-binding protein [Nitrososphaerota archaeon]|nr:extracellular solute-binding protein [Nitrososphaerota archaeon]MDG6970914.1 extracellular solute-binding protein [Nitrososphaerota archaeon]MDG6975644.1 extracellular solute-binding protein [Nitrososphaerota archaeon]